MKLVAFDGDHTLWTPLDGVNLSDRTPTDDVGRPDFSYALLARDPLVAVRDDGARFRLRAEVPFVLNVLQERGVLRGVISYNHEGNVRRILETFCVLSLVNYVVAEWSTRKGEMMQRMLALASSDGHNIPPGEALLIDDDPEDIYRGQCEKLGAGFRRFGVDISDLEEVLPLAEMNRVGPA